VTKDSKQCVRNGGTSKISLIEAKTFQSEQKHAEASFPGMYNTPALCKECDGNGCLKWRILAVRELTFSKY
jgi:hypothetical protein